MMQNVAKGPFSFADQYVLLTFSHFTEKKNLIWSFVESLSIHPFEKTLSGEKYKRWTMQHNGTLGRWQGQVCYWVSFLDIENIFFPR